MHSSFLIEWQISDSEYYHLICISSLYTIHTLSLIYAFTSLRVRHRHRLIWFSAKIYMSDDLFDFCSSISVWCFPPLINKILTMHCVLSQKSHRIRLFFQVLDILEWHEIKKFIHYIAGDNDKTILDLSCSKCQDSIK